MISMNATTHTSVHQRLLTAKTLPEVITAFVRTASEMMAAERIVSILMNVCPRTADVLISASTSSDLMSAVVIKDINYQAMAERASISMNALNMVRLIYVLPRPPDALILPAPIIATVRLGSEMMAVIRIVSILTSVTNTHISVSKNVSILLALISAIANEDIV